MSFITQVKDFMPDQIKIGALFGLSSYLTKSPIGLSGTLFSLYGSTIIFHLSKKILEKTSLSKRVQNTIALSIRILAFVGLCFAFGMPTLSAFIFHTAVGCLLHIAVDATFKLFRGALNRMPRELTFEELGEASL